MPDEFRLKTLEENLEEIASVLLGPRRSQIRGGGRDGSNGLAQRLQHLEHNSEKRFTAIDDKFDRRLSSLESHVNDRFEGLENQVSEILEEVKKRRMTTPVLVALITAVSGVVATGITALAV